MNIGLGWLGVGVGVAGCSATYFMAAVSAGSGDVPTRRIRLAVGLTLLITIVFWAISMRQQYPFSPGQLLGLGFLIGGITGAAAIVLCFRLGSLSQPSIRTGNLAAGSVAFFALFGVSLTYSIFHGNPQNALIGFSIGAAMAAILGYYTQESEASPSAAYIEAWALFAITLAVGVVLAVNHFEQTALRFWWPLPILLATTVCIAGYVATELAAIKLSERPGLSYLFSTSAASVLVICLSVVYSWRVFESWQILHVVAVGIGVTAVVAWLSASMGKGKPPTLEIAAVLILLVMAFIVISFKLWAGLGIALGLIAAWSLVLPALGSGREGDPASPTLSHSPVLPFLRGVLELGLVILLFRLFIERYRFSLGGGDFRIHYTFVGAMLGVVLPFLFISSLARLKDSAGDTRLLASVGLVGLIAAVTPILLYFIWDVKVVTGWMFGSTAAVAFLLMVRLGVGKDGVLLRCNSLVLLVAGAQLVAIQSVEPLSIMDLARGTRIRILAVTLACVVLGLVIDGIMSARRER